MQVVYVAVIQCRMLPQDQCMCHGSNDRSAIKGVTDGTSKLPGK